ncbi:hypothetical protein AWZ03_009628 [Drosophila navojoa]|uniref:Spondin-like TSP1 domain-containing protein n=1 Tax=Drosophila navojoa TaxID=7232 RepID=A0A484B7V8_DRONA|nr:hypothetical protein AWZ03_009628 [Drosophila navojoa]
MPPPGRGYGPGPACRPPPPGFRPGPPPPGRTNVNVDVNIGARPPPIGVGIGFAPPPVVIGAPPIVVGAAPRPPVIVENYGPPAPGLATATVYTQPEVCCCIIISPAVLSEAERNGTGQVRAELGVAERGAAEQGSNICCAAVSYNNSQQPGVGNVVPKNDKHALLQSIASSYRRNDAANNNNNITGHPAKVAVSAAGTAERVDSGSGTASGSGAGSTRRRTSLAASKRRRDCRVSHWSEWTACSKSCGIGEMHRYRKVIKHGKRGGRPCPALQQSKWCGTERNCHGPQSYFNWSDSDT